MAYTRTVMVTYTIDQDVEREQALLERRLPRPNNGTIDAGPDSHRQHAKFGIPGNVAVVQPLRCLLNQ